MQPRRADDPHYRRSAQSTSRQYVRQRVVILGPRLRGDDDGLSVLVLFPAFPFPSPVPPFSYTFPHSYTYSFSLEQERERVRIRDTGYECACVYGNG